MILNTDIGAISLGLVDGVLVCEFDIASIDEEPDHLVAGQLTQYFSGIKVQHFSVTVPNSTPFTQRCWEACRKITYGETISYKELASRAGSPDASRAAGQAMRNNPQVIITPCHRVISSTGKLHGFAGSTSPNSIELKRKKFLLDLENSTMSA